MYFVVVVVCTWTQKNPTFHAQILCREMEPKFYLHNNKF